MKNFQLFSRRNTEREKVDFRPDPDPKSPFAQLRRLEFLLADDKPGPGDLENCDEAINAYREYSYRKIFTGTTHEQFTLTDNENPEVIDWLLAVATVENNNFRNNRR